MVIIEGGHRKGIETCKLQECARFGNPIALSNLYFGLEPLCTELEPQNSRVEC